MICSNFRLDLNLRIMSMKNTGLQNEYTSCFMWFRTIIVTLLISSLGLSSCSLDSREQWVCWWITVLLRLHNTTSSSNSSILDNNSFLFRSHQIANKAICTTTTSTTVEYLIPLLLCNSDSNLSFCWIFILQTHTMKARYRT